MSLELSISDEQIVDIARRWLDLGEKAEDDSIEMGRLQGFNGLALDIGLMPALGRVAKRIQAANDKEEARRDRLAGFLVRDVMEDGR
jgi:hypothetical protein